MANLDIKALRTLQASINAEIDAYVSAAEKNGKCSRYDTPDIQEGIYRAATKLTQFTANPALEVYRIGLQHTLNLAIRVAIDLDLFNIIDDQASLHDLAQKTKADEVLIFRVMRLLVASNVFSEPEVNKYKSTPLSKMFAVPGCRDWMKLNFDILDPIWNAIPAYIAKNGYKDITDSDHSPWREVYDDNIFEYLAKNPDREAVFASAMALADAQTAEKRPQYPYQEFFSEVASLSQPEEAVFIVDIGGGKGQYLDQVIAKHPHIPGRVILQDLPEPIARAPQDAGYETMIQDFFQPQPIEGAKFYHLRHILHDWPDETCLKILRQLRPALKPRYSKLLVQTYVLANKDVDIGDAMLDLNMWVCCGMERSEAQWHRLLARAGFKISRIIRSKSAFAMIEAVLDDE